MINALSTLKFYYDLSHQNRYTKQCEGDDLHTLYCPNYQLPPFAFTMPRYNQPIGDFTIFNAATNTAVFSLYIRGDKDWDVTKQVVLYPTDANGVDYIIGTGNILTTANDTFTLDCGCYYIVITRGDPESANFKKLYSEVFCVKDNAAITDGENILVNGDFSQGFYSWTNAGGLVIAGGKASLLANVHSGVVLSKSVSTNDSGCSRFKYKVTFTISGYVANNPGSFIGISVMSGIGGDFYKRVTGNGTYTFYSDLVTHFKVYEEVFINFSIDNISIERVIGMEDMVGITTKNTCRGANAVVSCFADKFYLDARILETEYGETLKQDENGDFEQVNSFCRAFKKHPLEPLLLPEFIIDTLAKLNAFDYVGINKGEGPKVVYVLGPEGSVYNIPIATFELKNDWVGAGCYGLARLMFEETIALKNSCCDDVSVNECIDYEALETTPEINLTPGSGFVTITPVADFPTNSYIEVLTAPYSVDCDGDYTSTGIILITEQFNTSGFVFPYPGEAVCLKIRLYQTACDTEFVTNAVIVN